LFTFLNYLKKFPDLKLFQKSIIIYL